MLQSRFNYQSGAERTLCFPYLSVNIAAISKLNWHDPECREAHCVSLSEGSCKVSNATTYQAYIGMAGILFFWGRKKPQAKLANCSNINRQI